MKFINKDKNVDVYHNVTVKSIKDWRNYPITWGNFLEKFVNKPKIANMPYFAPSDLINASNTLDNKEFMNVIVNELQLRIEENHELVQKMKAQFDNILSWAFLGVPLLFRSLMRNRIPSRLSKLAITQLLLKLLRILLLLLWYSIIATLILIII
jgi:hypothetical protein